MKSILSAKKKRHYIKDYYLAFKKKPKDKKVTKEAKQTCWNRNQVADKATIAQSVDQDDLDLKYYSVNTAFITKNPSSKANNIWYLDFYASKYICKNQELFLDLQPKIYKFIKVGGKVIWS